MNQKNFEYLRDQVKYTGFGDALENELKEKIEKQIPEFQLTHNARYGNDGITASLQFKKSEQSDMYFFNSYQLNLNKAESADTIKQNFYINKADNITLKEAYNLVSGRAVNKDLATKEGQIYNAWLQIDFKENDKSGNYKVKQYHQNYGFDLNKELAKHPIKELANEQSRNMLLDSLNRGNKQSVTFMRDGNEQKHSIEANPKFKTVNVYDENMQRVSNRHAKDHKQGDGVTAAVKNDKKEMQRVAGEDGEPAETKSKKKTKKVQSIG